jgi:hypothetical protein
MEGRGLPFEQCHSSTIDCNRWLTVSWGILIYSILPPATPLTPTRLFEVMLTI